MTTYSLIIKKIINTGNNFFSSTYKEDGIDNIIRGFFNSFSCKEINPKNKFDFFSETLNSFYIKGQKEDEFINYFYKIQKIYYTLSRFAINYKHKIAKTVVNTDMELNELKYNSKNIICIMHKNSKYLFHANDLIKIIKTSLTNSHMFFSEPLPIKNPYNNIPFDKSTLYNIYYFIRYNTNYYCELLFKFFESDFNLTIFKYNNECLLREYAITNYVYNSTSDVLKTEIIQMIDYFNSNYCNNKNSIRIDKDFPKDKLIKIFQPYLLLFIHSEYSYLTCKKRESETYFKLGLKRFQSFNPQFGRKKYKILTKPIENFKRKIIGKLIEFDDKHIKFNDIKKQNKEFLTDHLSYNENYFTMHIIIYRNGNNDEEAQEQNVEEDEDEEEETNNRYNEDIFGESDDETEENDSVS